MAEVRYKSYLVDDFCGLRLQPLYDQRLAEKQGREAELARKLAEAAAERQQIICQMAEDGLGDEAHAWLDGPAGTDGARRRVWASESDQNLSAARSELRGAIHARKALTGKGLSLIFASNWRMRSLRPPLTGSGLNCF